MRMCTRYALLMLRALRWLSGLVLGVVFWALLSDVFDGGARHASANGPRGTSGIGDVMTLLLLVLELAAALAIFALLSLAAHRHRRRKRPRQPPRSRLRWSQHLRCWPGRRP